MRRLRGAVLAAAIGVCAGCGSAQGTQQRPAGHQPQCASRSTAEAASAYDRATLALGPVLYLTVRPGSASTEPDLAGCAPGGTFQPPGTQRAVASLPDGEQVAELDGSQSLRVPSSPVLSIPDTGALTIEAWIKPATLHFATVEGTGYVNWLGKGAPGEYEYELRMYSQGNSENRANRISGYAFNPSGGLGSGAYFQDPVSVGAWIMVAVEYDTSATSAYPTGWVSIFKDGVMRQRVALSQFHVIPHAGQAPFEIGTLRGRSYFQGSIAKVAVFDRVLPNAAIRGQYETMITQRK
jgi:Concanavalin A-like lectin/glucanases superfamily